MRDIINLGVVNFKVATGDKQANLSRIKEYAIAAGKRGADMIVFPEMCLMGYDYFIDEKIDRSEKIAATETVNGPSVKVLEAVAKEYGMYIIFGMSEKRSEDAEDLYNSAVVLGPNGLVGSLSEDTPLWHGKSVVQKGGGPLHL